MPAPDSGSLTAASQVLEQGLAAALDGHGIRTVFQPIVDLRRRTVVGYEALSRFGGPGGPPPDLVFEVAREQGVDAELQAAAIRRALSHRPDLPPNCFLTVNVEPEVIDTAAVRAAFAEAGRLGGVVVEITEHRPWQWNDLAPAIRRLRADGALIAVDDAGAGYSGLRQILEVRPSFLKLDRALIQGVDTDEAKAALVEMMGAFANRIDAWILAEGVETAGEANRLAELDVPLVQGYWFGRPAEPWADLDPLVHRSLAEMADRPGESLYPLVEPHPPLPRSERAEWARLEADHVAVIDTDRRPVGLLTPASAMAGELLPALVANATSSPAEVGHRLASSSVDPSLPVIVTDNAGRYLGLVTLRRLLTALSR